MCDRRDKGKESQGVTRRGFLGTVSAGAVVAAVGGPGRVVATPVGVVPEDMAAVELRINGRLRRLLVEPRWTLLTVLREQLGLTATKVGCEQGECGACTVLIDDQPRYACMTLALEAEGHDITTLEGLMRGEELGDVQKAFVDEDAYQCGYCSPGQIMAAEGLIRANPAPTVTEIREGMAGNLCRCAAYVNIVQAVDRVAEVRRGEGGRK